MAQPGTAQSLFFLEKRKPLGKEKLRMGKRKGVSAWKLSGFQGKYQRACFRKDIPVQKQGQRKSIPVDA